MGTPAAIRQVRLVQHLQDTRHALYVMGLSDVLRVEGQVHIAGMDIPTHALHVVEAAHVGNVVEQVELIKMT
jgi:hypothetical protein